MLGAGGQGEVYEVTFDVGPQGSSRSFAFKCYFPARASKEQWEGLSTLVDLGAPSHRFLWPQDLADLADRRTFGYLMDIRDDRFAGLTDLVRRVVPTTLRSLTETGFQLADSFSALHAQGLCYRDISLGNVFFDPRSGDVLICDNDNVAVDGRGHQSVLGTTGFMAPEVEREVALPSTKTDLHSLAVLLFLIFINNHPLIGRREQDHPCLDRPAMRQLYGDDPLFIFDPDDDSNRPVPGIHDNALVLWPIYPRYFQRLFTQAFTAGLHDPEEGRVRESTWKVGISRLKDLLMYCGCGAELFFDEELGAVAGSDPGHCWACAGTPTIPARLRIGARTVMLNLDTVLFPHHLGGNLYDYSHQLATVTAHPLDPRVLGLRNVSDGSWVATEPDGVVHSIGPGRSVRLTDGMRIDFGGAEGAIVVE